jgi:radical SAM protein with 4Fe4S-binding SPASM domain
MRELFGIASKLTLKKLLNFIRVIAGYYSSRLLRRPIVLGMPFALAIEPTTSCNLRCPECTSGLRAFTRPTGMLDMDFFKSIVDGAEKELMYLNFYFQGEPFLNRKLSEMISYSSAKKIYTSTSTNAHYLDDDNAKRIVESGLDRLIISIDGTTQAVYEKYRIGGSLEKVLKGAGNIIFWKKKLKKKLPLIVFQFLVVKHNEHQVNEAKKIAKEIGADKIVFKTAQINDSEDVNNLIPRNKRYSRYKFRNGKWEIKNKLLNHCWRLWHSTVITWDGKMVPCCFDKDANYKMGDLHSNSFNEIWNGNDYMHFRKSVLINRKNNSICTNCTEGTTVFN